MIKLSLKFHLRDNLLIFYATSADSFLEMAMIKLSLEFHLRDHLLIFDGTSVLADLVILNYD